MPESEVHYEKPPLGLIPFNIVAENRVQQILEACMRYNERGMNIPEEWIWELNNLRFLLEYWKAEEFTERRNARWQNPK